MGGIRKFKRRPAKKEREPFPKGGYKDIVRENAAFEAFYKGFFFCVHFTKKK